MEKKEGKIGKFVTFFKFWVSFIGSVAKIILTGFFYTHLLVQMDYQHVHEIVVNMFQT